MLVYSAMIAVTKTAVKSYGSCTNLKNVLKRTFCGQDTPNQNLRTNIDSNFFLIKSNHVAQSTIERTISVNEVALNFTLPPFNRA